MDLRLVSEEVKLNKHLSRDAATLTHGLAAGLGGSEVE
jgi:hypothetical protein